MPIWKINFCSSVLRLPKLPRCRERPQTDMLFRMIRKIKVYSRLTVSLMYNFLQ